MGTVVREACETLKRHDYVPQYPAAASVPPAAIGGRSLTQYGISVADLLDGDLLASGTQLQASLAGANLRGRRPP